jgi:hypothetical protein
MPTATVSATSTGVVVELTSIDVLIAGLEEMAKYLVEVGPIVKQYIEVSALLHEAPRRFQPSDDLQAALHHLFETVPDADGFQAWLEAVPMALKAAGGFKGLGEGFRGSGAGGDLEAAIGE